MRQTWTRVLVVASLAAVGALAVPSSPALARDRLVTSNPKRNATLDATPRQVAVTFSGQPLSDRSSITVVGPDGVDATDGGTKFRDTSMAIGFDATTKGEYTVAWEAVSADGERISGQYTFVLTSTRRPLGVAPRPGGDPVSPSPEAGSGGSRVTAPAAAAPRSDGAAAWLRDLPLTIWIAIASTLLLLVALVVLSAVGRRQLRPRPPGAGGPPA